METLAQEQDEQDPKGFWVEVSLNGDSFRTWVVGDTPNEVTQRVLEEVNIWVEDDDDLFSDIDELISDLL